MSYPKTPSYYFDFTFESSGNEAIDLEWISKKMRCKPSSTKLKGEKIITPQQIIETKFTQWGKQSKVYEDWNMDKNFEKFVKSFYKKQKHILQILQTYPITNKHPNLLNSKK